MSWIKRICKAKRQAVLETLQNDDQGAEQLFSASTSEFLLAAVSNEKSPSQAVRISDGFYMERAERSLQAPPPKMSQSSPP